MAMAFNSCIVIHRERVVQKQVCQCDRYGVDVDIHALHLKSFGLIGFYLGAIIFFGMGGGVMKKAGGHRIFIVKGGHKNNHEIIGCSQILLKSNHLAQKMHIFREGGRVIKFFIIK